MPENIRQQIIINAIDNTRQAFASAQSNSNELNNTLTRIKNTILGLATIELFVNAIPALVRFSDGVIELDGRLKVASASTADYNLAQENLIKISLDTHSSLSANIELYSRLITPLQALGFETEQITRLTSVMASGLRLGGATTAESASVMLQFSQAMGSGVLRGEEFNAISEASIPIMKALADGIGVPVGALKEMASEGKLTSDIVIEALLKQEEAFAEAIKSLPLTIGRAFEDIKTKTSLFILENKAFNSSIASGLSGIANNFDTVVTVIGGVILLFGVKLVAGIIKSTIAMTAQSAEAQRIARLDQANHVRRRANAQVEERATARATALENRRNLDTTRQASIESVQARRRESDSVNEQRALIRTIELERVRQAGVTVQHQQDVRTALNSRDRLRSIGLLNASIIREGTLTQTLSASKLVLTEREIVLATAIRAETVAHIANTGAIATSAVATAGAIGATTARTAQSATRARTLRLQWLSFIPLIRGVTTVFKTLFTFLGGWIGVAIVGIITLASEVDNWGLAWLAVETTFLKVFATLTTGVKELFGFDESLEAELSRIDAYADEQIATLNDIEGKAKKIRDEAEKDKIKKDKAEKDRRDTLLDAEKRQIEAINGARLKAIKADERNQKEYSDSVLREVKVRQKVAEEDSQAQIFRNQETFTNLADFNAESNRIQLEANQAVLNVTRETVNGLIAEWSTFYDSKRESIEADEKLTAELTIREKESQKKLYLFLAKEIDKVIDKNETLYKKALSDIERFTDDVNKLQQSTSDFLFNLNRDDLSNAEIASHARSKLVVIERELNELNSLDQVRNAELIKEKRGDLIKQLEKIITSEKTRGKDFKEDSLDQIDSQENVNRAVAQYKGLVDDAIGADQESIIRAKGKAKVLEEARDDQIEQLNNVNEKINEIDKQIDAERLILVDVNTESAKESVNDLEKALETTREKMEEPIVISVDVEDAVASIQAIKIEASERLEEELEKVREDAIAQRSKDELDSKVSEILESVNAEASKIIKDNEGFTDYSYQYRNSGGIIDNTTPLRLNDGGYARTRGRVSGIGSDDNQKALLTAGEFVVRRQVVDDLGVNFFNKVNAGVPVQDAVIHRFSGGLVNNSDSDNNSIRSSIRTIEASKDRFYGGNTSFGTSSGSERQNAKDAEDNKGKVAPASIGIWQSGYYDDLAKIVDGFKDADGSVQRQAVSIASNITNNLERSFSTLTLDEYNSTVSQINSDFRRFDSLSDKADSIKEKDKSDKKKETTDKKAESEAKKIVDEARKAKEAKFKQDLIGIVDDAQSFAVSSVSNARSVSDSTLISVLKKNVPEGSSLSTYRKYANDYLSGKVTTDADKVKANNTDYKESIKSAIDRFNDDNSDEFEKITSSDINIAIKANVGKSASAVVSSLRASATRLPQDELDKIAEDKATGVQRDNDKKDRDERDRLNDIADERDDRIDDIISAEQSNALQNVSNPRDVSDSKIKKIIASDLDKDASLEEVKSFVREYLSGAVNSKEGEADIRREDFKIDIDNSIEKFNDDNSGQYEKITRSQISRAIDRNIGASASEVVDVLIGNAIELPEEEKEEKEGRDDSSSSSSSSSSSGELSKGEAPLKAIVRENNTTRTTPQTIEGFKSTSIAGTDNFQIENYTRSLSESKATTDEDGITTHTNRDDLSGNVRITIGGTDYNDLGDGELKRVSDGKVLNKDKIVERDARNKYSRDEGSNRVTIDNEIFSVDEFDRLTNLKTGSFRKNDLGIKFNDQSQNTQSQNTLSQASNSGTVESFQPKALTLEQSDEGAIVNNYVPPSQQTITTQSDGTLVDSNGEKLVQREDGKYIRESSLGDRPNVFANEKKLKDNFSDYSLGAGTNSEELREDFNAEKNRRSQEEQAKQNKKDADKAEKEALKVRLKAEKEALKAKEKAEKEALKAREDKAKAIEEERARIEEERLAEIEEKRAKIEANAQSIEEERAKIETGRLGGTSTKNIANDFGTSTKSIANDFGTVIKNLGTNINNTISPALNTISTTQQNAVNNNSRSSVINNQFGTDVSAKKPVILQIRGQEIRGHFDDNARTRKILEEIERTGAVN
jgi:tape measure domain-containing protein